MLSKSAILTILASKRMGVSYRSLERDGIAEEDITRHWDTLPDAWTKAHSLKEKISVTRRASVTKSDTASVKRGQVRDEAPEKKKGSYFVYKVPLSLEVSGEKFMR